MRDRQHQANGDNRDTPSGSEGVGKAEIDFQSSLRSSAWVQPEASRNEPSSRVVKGLTNPLLVKTRTQFQILKPTQDARLGNSLHLGWDCRIQVRMRTSNRKEQYHDKATRTEASYALRFQPNQNNV